MDKADEPLDIAIQKLESSIKEGVSTQLQLTNEKGDTVSVTASRLEVRDKPFELDKSEKYESVLSEMQLVPSSTSQTSLEVGEEVSSARECHDKCVKETSMSCASFSFCSNNKKCRLSSIYIGPEGNEKEVVTATNCQVYRMEALRFFEEYPGQTLRSRGVKSLEFKTASECAFFCRIETEFRCRGFDICSGVHKCILTASHALDIPDVVNPSSSCKHYSMKYSSEFKDMGRLLAVDPKRLTVISTTFEECARLCYMTEDFNCKSINYCPQQGDDSAYCELNTVSTFDDGVETKESDPCQHYVQILKAPEVTNNTNSTVSPGLFVPYYLAIETGFQAHVEIKMKITDQISEVFFVDEYHDLKMKRGRFDIKSSSASKNAFYYNAVKDEVAVVTGNDCKVSVGANASFFQDKWWWGWKGNFSVTGPSGVLFRETVGMPKFNATITTDRGIVCNLYDGYDKVDTNIKIQYCIAVDDWSTPGKGQVKTPIFVKYSGISNAGILEQLDMDFTFFKADKINQLFFKVPKGIGCQGLQPETITNVADQFSYVLEMYDKPIGTAQLHPKVLLYKVMYNNLEKLLKVNGITGDEPYTEIQDYNTGINYHTNENDECKIGSIQESLTAKITAFSGELTNPKEFLSLNGDFYYLGQDLQRGIYCDIFEAVKTNYKFMGMDLHKVVVTYFFSSSMVDSKNVGYTNYSTPVALQISLYPTSEPEKMQFIEYNYFRFEEASGKISYTDSNIFYEGMNIENCFPDEGQKSHFLITFPTSEEMSKAAKANHRWTQLFTLFQIKYQAHVTYLRLPMLKIFYEPNNILVEGLMLERPPIAAGFYENKDSMLYPTVGDGGMTVAINNEDCAANCLESNNCTGFTTCKTNRGRQLECYLISKGKNSTNWGTKILDKECNLFFKSVTSETISDEPLVVAIQSLKAAANNKQIQISYVDENDSPVNFTSGSFETVENPFGFGKSEKYESVLEGYELLPHEGSETSLEVGEVVSSARECHDKCIKETSLACAAFSFCPNQKRCRLSSIYVGPNNKDEVQIASNCQVYRTEALNYFDVFPGVTLPSKGFKSIPTIVSASDCAFACRNEKTQTCRGFDFCSSPRQCVLTTSHALDFAILQNSTARCKHYSLKYSAEFIDMGKFIVVDPKALKLPENTFEQCAKTCYLTEDFNCKSINYCPQLGEDRAYCELNTVSSFDDGVETKEADPCQHYVQRATPDVPTTVSPWSKVFVPLQDMVKDGFETHVEVNLEFGDQTHAHLFMNEYHNIELGQGRSDMTVNGLRNSLYYFFDTEELVSISGSVCHVSKYDETGSFTTSPFWGWQGNDSIIGPSGILFRDSVNKMQWVAEEYVRGALCDKFEGFDKEHPRVKVAHWYTALDWFGAVDYAIRVPVKASAIGIDNKNIPVYTIMYFTSFRPGQIAPEILEIPRGLGCEGLSIVPPSANLPKLNAQYSFEAEYYDMAAPVIRPNSKVSMYRIWHDGLGNVTKIVGTNTGDNLLFTEIHDFNTGINYRFNEVDICTVGPIITIGDRKALSGIVSAMKSPLEFLALDGTYYYMGKALQRGIDCHIWESVKFDFIITNEPVDRAVYTYFFSTPKTESVSDGDENLLIPVALQISVYDKNEKVKFIEMNFFRFDEPMGRTFYDDIKIANCFMEESQKSYFSVYFQTPPQNVLIAKESHQVFENLASLAIVGAANVSPLRLPYIKVYYEYDNIIILGNLVERPATLAGFYRKTDDPKILPTKGEKTAADVSTDDGCASTCVGEKSFACTGFSTCKSPEATGKLECYLTSNDGSRPWGAPMPGKECKLFLKAVKDAKMQDAFLKDAIQLLEQKVNNGSLTVLIQDSVTSEPVEFTASSAQIHLKPITFGDSELYEELISGKQLASDSQTTLELQDEVSSARECYDRCLKETSISCGTFSYCATRHKCSLSSLYISKDDKKGEMKDATNCKTYRKNALKFFEQYPGMTSSTGTASLKINTPEDCAYACQNQTDITCRSFDFCQISKSCFLSESHGVKLSNIQKNSYSCSHYSLKYSSEFVDKGHDIIVDSTAELRNDLTFEECAKACYENEKFKCLSFNYCPVSQIRVPVCELITKSALDANMLTKRSDTCQNYYRRDMLSPEKPKEIKDDSKRVSNGAFAGTLIGMLIVGIVLGVIGFMIFSYYKAKKAGEQGFTIRYTRAT